MQNTERAKSAWQKANKRSDEEKKEHQPNPKSKPKRVAPEDKGQKHQQQIPDQDEEDPKANTAQKRKAHDRPPEPKTKSSNPLDWKDDSANPPFTREGRRCTGKGSRGRLCTRRGGIGEGEKVR